MHNPRGWEDEEADRVRRPKRREKKQEQKLQATAVALQGHI